MGSFASTMTADVKLFQRWTFDDLEVNDLSLQDYIGVKNKCVQYLPHSAGRWSKVRFRKAQCPIIERLTCSLMMHGRNNGKKLLAVRIIKHTLEIIHLLTDQNPIQVVVNAIINGGPREDSTRIGTAGVVRRQAVDVSPLRRVNFAIYLLATGARSERSLAPGLHWREEQVRSVPPAFGWSLEQGALPQGPMPHHRAPHVLPDDARPQQRLEASRRAHYQAHPRDHPPAHRPEPDPGGGQRHHQRWSA